ncbi:hypothetical protein Cni_G00046 [Canna indica]|uniref:Uncharacterized protein n=1 Tax=Canna indica TaxID=4628 RepID=A0AAQ3JLS3_9LILI|nr:hypothetical protein Cni_G00046 [Canna indica]
MASEVTRNHHRPQGTGGSNSNGIEASTPPELLLQWGSRKRLRCVKLQRKDEDDALPGPAHQSGAVTARADRALRRAASAACKQLLLSPEATASGVRSKRGEASPEGSTERDDQTQTPALAWPKLELGLTNKEKEEDYLAFKGSKLPQRPKKRAKPLQRTINLVCPGSWLCDLTMERYEVREKKTSKKRPRGLKAMGNMESDSE